uniref:F-box domain-containing protein n=1 Tax=Caenorhabditis tropicalis TaxID=1561998 RepID=A0A1I7TCJ1_9PELO
MSIPLSYGSMTTILERTEANKRFETARRCSSFDKTDRVTPLWIDYMKLERGSGPNIMKINGTTYTTGTVRVYPKGVKIPFYHKKENKGGGVFHDFDQYGMSRREEEGSNGESEQMDEVQFSSELEFQERQFHELLHYMDFRKDICSYDGDSLLYAMYEEDGDDIVLRDIEMAREDLQLLYNRRDKNRVAYKPMSQLLIRSTDGEDIIKRSNRSLMECEDALFKTLFGNRDSINVKCLEIDYRYETPSFHPDLKLKVQELKLAYYPHKLLDAVLQIIDPSCLPLKRVSLDYLSNSKHDLINSAKTLVIWNLNTYSFDELTKLPNREVIIYYQSYYRDIFDDAILKWMEQERPIGSYCLVYLLDEKNISRTMEKLKKHGDQISQRCINIPKNDSSIVQVTYWSKETVWPCRTVWLLKWEVVAA